MNAIVESAVAVVLSAMGNHNTERRGGADVVTQPVMPMHNEPIAVSLKYIYCFIYNLTGSTSATIPSEKPRSSLFVRGGGTLPQC